MNGTKCPYAKPAKVASKLHPISKAFQHLASGECSSNYRSAYLYSEISIDGQKVTAMPDRQSKYSRPCPDNMIVDVDLLRTLATPAPFGKGSENIVDDTVRKALEIEASRIALTTTSKFDIISSTLEEVASTGKKLVPHLYKLHMYEEGGMFLTHRDTLHASNHYATLIVGLPTEYTGGEFALEVENGKEKKFDLRSKNGNKFLIFLPDMRHQILKVRQSLIQVETGVRVVLQYDLYLEDLDVTEEDERGSCDEEDEEDLDYSCDSFYQTPAVSALVPEAVSKALAQQGRQEILLAVDEFIAANPNDQVSFLLSPRSVEFDNLKAGDRTLYAILSENYHVSLGLAVNAIETDYDGRFEEEDCKSLNVVDYRCRTALDAFILGYNSQENAATAITEKADAATEDNPSVVGSNTAAYESHVFLGNGASFERVKNTDYMEYTGNEAAPGEYVYVTLVLAVGPRKN